MGNVFQRMLDLIYGCKFPLHHYAFSSYLVRVQRDGEYVCIDLQHLHAVSLRDPEQTPVARAAPPTPAPLYLSLWINLCPSAVNLPSGTVLRWEPLPRYSHPGRR